MKKTVGKENNDNRNRSYLHHYYVLFPLAEDYSPICLLFEVFLQFSVEYFLCRQAALFRKILECLKNNISQVKQPFVTE